MFIFNAFQLVLLFAAGPFLITYVKDASFYAHNVLFWVLIVSYLWGFGAMVYVVSEKMEGR